MKKYAHDSFISIKKHGGAWANGDKKELTVQSLYFRDKGFAVINMNYRLTGTPENNIHPAQQTDIAAVVNYVSSNAFDWHVSADKLGLIGVSAGAHLDYIPMDTIIVIRLKQ